MNNLITVSGVNGYIDESGTAWLNTEAVSRGLGFTQLKDSKEYVRWERVNGYLCDMNFPQLVGKEFIPENVFYRLSMKGETESAKAFQIIVADEILPSIRKTGSYTLQPKLPQTYAEALRELANAWEENQILLPKAQYFDALVDRNLLTNFRDTAKELKIKEGFFIDWLLEKGYIYRDLSKKLKPYAQHVDNLFELKEWGNDKKAGTQTLITPRGRETFRLLLAQSKHLVKF